MVRLPDGCWILGLLVAHENVSGRAIYFGTVSGGVDYGVIEMGTLGIQTLIMWSLGDVHSRCNRDILSR